MCEVPRVAMRSITDENNVDLVCSLHMLGRLRYKTLNRIHNSEASLITAMDHRLSKLREFGGEERSKWIEHFYNLIELEGTTDCLSDDIISDLLEEEKKRADKCAKLPFQTISPRGSSTDPNSQPRLIKDNTLSLLQKHKIQHEQENKFRSKRIKKVGTLSASKFPSDSHSSNMMECTASEAISVTSPGLTESSSL